MSRFDYVVSLDLTDRRCVVLGGGPLAVDRAEGLVRSGARVEVYARDPDADLLQLPVEVHRRTYRPGDLAGAFLAVATLEDDADVPAAWDEAGSEGLLFAALDDVEHCHFAAPAVVSRGDLSVTISTAGRAPALSKRLRQRLEERITDAHGALVDVLHEAREAALPRTVPFDTWAGRWEDALADLDGLVELVRDRRTDQARRRVLDAITGGDRAPAREVSA